MIFPFFFTKFIISPPIPIASLSKAQVCTHCIAGIAGSNPTEVMDVLVFLCVCCAVEVPAMGRSIIKRSPSKCGVPEYDLEILTVRLSRPQSCCYAI